jgi:hypothetical protein
MQKSILLISFLFGTVLQICGQTGNAEPAKYSSFTKSFVAAFNADDFSLIKSYASANFLQAVKEDRFHEFISGIRRDFGRVTAYRFKFFDKKGSAVYHTELERTWFNFYIGLDDSSRLARFVILNPNYNEDIPTVHNRTVMYWPFDTVSHIFWGGDSEEQNYHVQNRAQKNAFDIVTRNPSGRSYRTDGKSNEDYYIFGRNVYSPCRGTIVELIDGVKENKPGEMNPAQLTGNSMVIRSDKNEFILLAHLQQGSIKLSKGDKVKPGDLLGRCGNTGNSSEPHLHLHIMDKPRMDSATGIKCYFKQLRVNGELKQDYSPTRGEKVEAVQKY